VVLDEAHRLAMSDGSPVQRILREGRKFGVGVILASQQPEDFDTVAYTNTATKLAFHLFDDSGRVVKQLRRRATEGMSVEQLAKTMSSLPRGSAYVISSDGGAVVRLFSNEEAQAHRGNVKQRTSR
jgi:DNA helicase HerA-like ATPase